jgi:hypothetical protein
MEDVEVNRRQSVTLLMESHQTEREHERGQEKQREMRSCDRDASTLQQSALLYKRGQTASPSVAERVRRQPNLNLVSGGHFNDDIALDSSHIEPSPQAHIALPPISGSARATGAAVVSQRSARSLSLLSI